MRILLTTETFLPKVDGIVKVVCLTLEYMQSWGYEVVILVPQTDRLDYAGATVYAVPSIPNPVYPEGRLGFPHWNTYRVIRNFKPDLIHAMGPALIGTGAILMAKTMHIPTVASFHLSISDSVRAYGYSALAQPIHKSLRWVFNQTDHALAPSKISKQMMESVGVRRVGWWRRGVDTTNFNPSFRNDAMRNLLSDGHPDDVILLYVGRLAPDKQIHQFRAVLEQVPNTRLALVGGGPYEDELRHIFAGLPVNFVGYKLGTELAEAYASADMFVFASAHETFGLVLAEAIASGLPVVTTRVGGAEDVVIPGENGYIFERDDIRGLVAFVRELAEQPAKRAQMSQAARRVAESMTWAEMMTELRHFYEDILSEKQHLPPPNRPLSPLYQPKAKAKAKLKEKG